jgi:hypothetical protein
MSRRLERSPASRKPAKKAKKLRKASKDIVSGAFDARELATVLASLRYWQTDRSDRVDIPERYDDIATDGNTLVPLDNEEIDVLCERLNCGGKRCAP